MRDPLTRSQLKRMMEHKYCTTGVSVLDPFLQGFWKRVVEWIPLWLSPNALTLGGLLLNAFTIIILSVSSPDSIAEPSSWCFYLCAATLFVYQTLDAVDGKHARRINSSSPLGELLDHGSDSLSIVFAVLEICIALQLGTSPKTMLFISFTTVVLFYSAHWQAYCSGKLRFGFIDVTEAQDVFIVTFLLTGFYGCRFWYTELCGVKLQSIAVGSMVLSVIKPYYVNFYVILMQGGVGRNGSTVAGTSVLSPLFPISIFVLAAITIWAKSTTDVFERNIVLYIFSFSFVSSKIIIRLVVAHLSRTEMIMLDSTLCGPGLLFLNQYFSTFVDELIVLWLCFVFCFVDLLYYSVKVCRQMSDFMNVSIFFVASRDKIVPGGDDVGTVSVNSSGASVRVSRNDVGTGSSHSRSSSSSSCDATAKSTGVRTRSSYH